MFALGFSQIPVLITDFENRPYAIFSFRRRKDSFFEIIFLSIKLISERGIGRKEEIEQHSHRQMNLEAASI